MTHVPDNFQDDIKAARVMAETIRDRIDFVGKQATSDVDQSEIDFVYDFINAMKDFFAKHTWN
jgi:hypothetical protein